MAGDPTKIPVSAENQSKILKFIKYVVLGCCVTVAVVTAYGPKWDVPLELAPPDQKLGSLHFFWNLLPVRKLSRITASVSSWQLPVSFRSPLYSFFGKWYDVDFLLYEPDLRSFKSFQEFFSRPMKYPRAVADAELVSPADGVIVAHGKVEAGGVLEQVKGVTYYAKGFLGTAPKINFPGNQLYYCVIYLAPGNYHRFHSAASWEIQHVRHFPGRLFVVRPSFTKHVPGLLSMSERVVMTGQRNSKFFSLTPVGAYNVGSIVVNCDKNIQTNIVDQDIDAETFGTSQKATNPYPLIDSQIPWGQTYEKLFERPYHVDKGEELGYFKLGSTIVIVFEESPAFKFSVDVDAKVTYGDELGS